MVSIEDVSAKAQEMNKDKFFHFYYGNFASGIGSIIYCNSTIKPTLKGLSELGTNFKGFLYAGLMIDNNDNLMIETIVRFFSIVSKFIDGWLKAHLTINLVRERTKATFSNFRCLTIMKYNVGNHTVLQFMIF